jgi:hypothetical protein
VEQPVQITPLLLQQLLTLQPNFITTQHSTPHIQQFILYTKPIPGICRFLLK